MKHYEYKQNGVCSRTVSFDIDDEQCLHNVHFLGGCPGNLSAISRLVEGRKASDVAEILKGNICGVKSTSCADQFSQAILKALEA